MHTSSPGRLFPKEILDSNPSVSTQCHACVFLGCADACSRARLFAAPPRVRASDICDNISRRFYNEGMPTETPTFNKTLLEESEALADKWAKAASQQESKLADPEAAKFEAWTSPQKVRLYLDSKIYLVICTSRIGWETRLSISLFTIPRCSRPGCTRSFSLKSVRHSVF